MANSKVDYWLSDDGLALLKGWARDGLTDEQIAKNMKISRSTLSKYKKEYSDISDTIKKNKEIVDYEVENALLKKALGYTITLGKQKVTKDGDVVNITEDIHIVPDSTAIIFWLKNRQPKKWRDKVEIDNKNKTDDKVLELLSKIEQEANNESINK